MRLATHVDSLAAEGEEDDESVRGATLDDVIAGWQVGRPRRRPVS